MSALRIPFIDLHPGEDAADVRAAIERVLARGWFVLGPEVAAFEREFAEASGARFAIGVGNGTDAIELLLRAAGIGTGDEVLVPAMTAAFTGLAVLATGALPVLVDVDDDTLTMEPRQLEAAITTRTRAIVPVHLYGQPAPLDAIYSLAERHELAVVEDCCQAHLATSGGVVIGTRGIGGAFSFYPTKNLGALGDGGAVITNDAVVADRIRMLRNGGQRERYRHVEAGINSRLDELQAAVLRVRLRELRRHTERRRHLAGLYRECLPAHVRAVVERDSGHVYHLFAVRSPERDMLIGHLRAAGVETLTHYPIALTDQEAFAAGRRAACHVAERAARELLSLPLRPSMSDADVKVVCEAISTFSKGHVQA